MGPVEIRSYVKAFHNSTGEMLRLRSEIAKESHRRTAIINLLHKGGLSFAAISSLIGISRARIGQLLAIHQAPTPEEDDDVQT